jgi:hypothetical protein
MLRRVRHAPAGLLLFGLASAAFGGCSSASSAPGAARDGAVTLAEVGDPCTGDATCASGMCDLTYPFGLCYAACHADGDCGDVTMKLCGADGRCYLACRTDVDCEPGAATCAADAPPRSDGKMLCRGRPVVRGDAGAADAADAADAAAAEAAPPDAPADAADAPAGG